MAYDEAVIAVFSDHQGADAALKKLMTGGIAIGALSIIGKGHHPEEKVVGFYHAGDHITFWGRRGAFWGGLWDVFPGGVSLSISGTGQVMVLGYLASIVVSAVEGAILTGGLTPLGAALYSAGIPKDSVAPYELAVKAGGFLVIVHGVAEELAGGETILGLCHPMHVDLHVALAPMPNTAPLSSSSGSLGVRVSIPG